MEATKKILSLICVIGIIIILASCGPDDDPVNVPFDFSIADGDDNGVKDEFSDNYKGTITIPGSWTQNTDNVKFKVSGQILDDKHGEINVNGGHLYTSYPIINTTAVSVPKGDFNITYKGLETGLHRVVITITNDANVVARDTIEIQVKQFETVEFFVSATPNDWSEENTAPGSQISFQLNVDSPAALSWKYRLYYENITSNGKANIYQSGSVYNSGGELSARSSNLKLNIPADHPTGNFELKLRIVDANLDEHSVILKYLVVN